MDALSIAVTIFDAPLFLVRESVIGYYIHSYSELKKSHGPFHAFILLFIFPDASNAMASVRNNLFRASDHDVMLIKKSLADDCSMMAVAAAIIAQIAISALSLTDLSSTHWTAKAAFIASLVSGALSVFYASLLQQKISSFIDPDSFKDWLGQPGRAEDRRQVEDRISEFLRIDRYLRQEESGTDKDQVLRDIKAEAEKFVRTIRWKRPSLSTIQITRVPRLLLDHSVKSFLAGLGIYLGCVAFRHLDQPQTDSGSIAVFIVFVAVSVHGILYFYIPELLKEWEMVPIRRWDAILGTKLEDRFRGKNDDETERPSPGLSAEQSRRIGDGTNDIRGDADPGGRHPEDEGLPKAKARVEECIRASAQAQEQCAIALRQLLEEFQKVHSNRGASI